MGWLAMGFVAAPATTAGLLHAEPPTDATTPESPVRFSAPATAPSMVPTEPAGAPFDLSRFRPLLGLEPPGSDPCATGSTDPRALLCGPPSPSPPMIGLELGAGADDPIAPARSEVPQVPPDLRRAWGVETNQYFVVHRVAELDGAPGPEFVYLSWDGFLVGADASQHDLWRWTPARWAEALGFVPDAFQVRAFSGWTWGLVSLSSERPLALGDVTGDGRDDVFLSLLLFPRAAWTDTNVTASSALLLIDGATGELLWWQPVAGLARHTTLLDVNRDGVLDYVYARENGPALEFILFSHLGDEASPRGAVEALDGRTRALAWSHPLEGDWTMAQSFDVADADADGDPDVVLFTLPHALGAPYSPDRDQRVTVLDAATGRAQWSRPAGRVMVFGLAAGPNLVVLHSGEITVTPSGVLPQAWTVHALDGRTGDERWSRTLPRTLLWSARSVDVRADAAPEVVLTGLRLDDAADYYREAFVATWDANGTPVWRHSEWSDPVLDAGPPPRLRYLTLPLMVDTQAAARREATATLATVLYRLPTARAELLFLDGDTGAASARPGPYSFLHVVPAGAAFYAADAASRLDRVAPDRTERLGTPLAHLLYALVPADLDGDAEEDFVVAGEAGVIYAVARPDAPDRARTLWHAPCGDAQDPSPVYDLRLSSPEAGLVVGVARDRVCAVEAATGAPVWSYERPPERVYETYARADLADLNGDGVPDAVVAGTRVFALDGRTGRELWSFGTPADSAFAGVSEYPLTYERWPAANAFGLPTVADLNGDQTPDVAFEFALDYPRQRAQVAALDGRTGLPMWVTPAVAPFLIPALWDSTLAVDVDGDGTREVAALWIQGIDPTSGAQPGVASSTHVAVFEGATGLPRWSVKVPGVVVLMGLRALPLPTGGHALLAVDLLAGWALIQPDGQVRAVERAHVGEGVRGGQPWDVALFDANGDGVLDVAHADFKAFVNVYEGRAFLDGRLEPLHTYHGPAAARLVPTGDPAAPLAVAAFPHAAWVRKHYEAGILILGGLHAPRGAGALTAQALDVAGAGDEPAPGRAAAWGAAAWAGAGLAVALAAAVAAVPVLRRRY